MQIISSFVSRLLRREVSKSLVLKFYYIGECTSKQNGLLGKKALEIVKSTIKSFWTGEQQGFHRVEVNYGSRVYHSVKDFFADSDFHQAIDVESIHLLSQGRGELYLSYNPIENCSFGSKYLLELVVHSYDMASKALNKQISLIQEFAQSGVWDYGYAYKYESGYDIFTEEREKRGLFSSTTTVSQNVLERRKKMKEIKSGYLPKLYPYNILNNSQKDSELISSIIGEWFSINSDLSFFKMEANAF